MDSRVGLITLMKGIRSFMQGFLVLILPLYLAHDGVGALGIGLLATLSLMASVFYTLVFTRLASRVGVKWALFMASLLMATSGVLLFTAHGAWSVVAAALAGYLPPSGGVFQDALEQGVLSNLPSDQRTLAFSRYGLVAAACGAIGSLCSGIPWLHGEMDGSIWAGGTDRLFFLAYLCAGLLVAFISTFTNLETELDGPVYPKGIAAPPPSRPFLAKVAALYVTDNLGSGLVTSTLMIFWLHAHFGMTPGQLSVLYFGMDVLGAVSYPLAERLSRKIGLVNTAVWTHLPCGVMLMAIPFLPNIAMVFALFWVRSLLVEMDVPTRQAFIAGVVRPEERTAAAGITSASEQVGQAFGPAVGGLILQTAGAAVPFLIGGALKVAYDLTLWRLFRTQETA